MPLPTLTYTMRAFYLGGGGWSAKERRELPQKSRSRVIPSPHAHTWDSLDAIDARIRVIGRDYPEIRVFQHQGAQLVEIYGADAGPYWVRDRRRVHLDDVHGLTQQLLMLRRGSTLWLARGLRVERHSDGWTIRWPMRPAHPTTYDDVHDCAARIVDLGLAA